MTRISKLRAIAVATVLAVFGFGSAVVSAAEVTVEDFNKAFEAANEVRKQAGSLGHEWRDTAKILKSAMEAAQGGDLDKAMKLVDQARLQAEAGVVQANREGSLWEGRVIR